MDFTLALAAAIILLPPMIVVSLFIKLTDPGPVLFVQTRVGRDGQLFSFYKFRSMPVGTRDVPSDKLGEIQLSRVGRIIRRTNIDELPQLLNVIVGDMSIVGPRPPVPTQEKLIELRRKSGALKCRPGLTGLAQVSAYDGMSAEEKAGFDERYARNVTFLNDLKIIGKTFIYLSKAPPVY